MIVSIKKLVVLAGLALVLATSFGAPAHADWDRHGGWHDRGWHDSRWGWPGYWWHPYRAAVVVPPAVYVGPQPVYAPPVVYAPSYGYYSPGLSVNIR